MRNDIAVTIMTMIICTPLWFWSLEMIEDNRENYIIGWIIFLMCCSIMVTLVMHHVAKIINDNNQVPF